VDTGKAGEMKLWQAFIGGLLILLLCWGLGEVFGLIYELALHVMHGAPEAVFVPYYVVGFIGIVLVLYFSNGEVGGKG
jgi:hypothetical protein